MTTGRLSARWNRLNGPQRIAGIDLARGLAGLGMLAAHLLSTGDFLIERPETWLAIVDGRSSILFATLAGVSIGLVTGGPDPLPPSSLRTARMRLVVRGFLLWMLGLLLVATGVPIFVILPAYGILFLLASTMVSLRARVLLPLAGVLALVMPFVQVSLDALPIWATEAGRALDAATGWHYPFPVWIAFVIAGMGVARAGILSTRVQLWTLAAGGALALLGYGLASASGASRGEEATYGDQVWTARPHSSGLLEVIGSGGFALAVIAACVLICRSVLIWIVLPLRAVGTMPLTSYTAQVLIWWAIALALFGDPADGAAFRELDPFWPMTAGIVVGATSWALLVGRGPLEWMVDRLTSIAVPSELRPRLSDTRAGAADPPR